MKNKFSIVKLFLVFAIPLFLFNCSTNEVTEENIEKLLEDSPVVDKLLEMGYDRERIQELDRFYLVQGDLLFSKNIDDYSQRKNTKQGDMHGRHAHTNNLVSQTNVTSMTVYVDPSVSVSGIDNWKTAVTEAINDLNSISGSKVNFILSTNSGSDIIVKNDNNVLPNNVIAAAGFPTSNQPYNTVLINLNFLSNIDVSNSTKRYNMVHEFGHCIGLRHTNWETNDPPNSIGANLIPGTPSQDPNSVMNGGTATFSWNGFSTYDIISIQYLYPPIPNNTPIPLISGPNYMGNGVNTVTWDYDRGVPNAQTFRWWYKKVNNGGIGPIVIAYGSSGHFTTISDTYYSNTSYRTSDFEIYLEVTDTNGNTYTSASRIITKKGKFKLVGLF